MNGINKISNGKGLDVRLIIQIGTLFIMGVSMYFALRGDIDVIKVEMKNDREKISTFVSAPILELQFKTINEKLDKLLKTHDLQ